MPPNACLVFDLDGTLVDSVPDLTSSVNRLLAARDLAPLQVPQIVAMVGDGAQALLARVFAARGLRPDASAMDDFLADYEAHAADRSVPYPSVPETLRILAELGYIMAVCTNKPEQPARRVLEELDLARYFAALGGGDSYPTRKPDPGHLLAAIKAAGADPVRAVMIGDHANDIKSARGANVPAIFAAWGYGPPEMAEGAAFTADAFGEIPGLAARLLSPAVS